MSVASAAASRCDQRAHKSIGHHALPAQPTCPSMLRNATSSSPVSTRNSICALSVTTSGRWVSEWGQTGVTTNEVTMASGSVRRPPRKRRRTGRSRNDHAIGLVVEHERPVDQQVEVDQPGDGAFVDDGVVQGEKWPDTLPRGTGCNRGPSALLQGRGQSPRPRGVGYISLSGTSVRNPSDPRFTARMGTPSCATDARGGRQGPVSPQHQGEIWMFRANLLTRNNSSPSVYCAVSWSR